MGGFFVEKYALAKNDPYAALRYRDFTFYISGSFLITSAILIQEVILGYEIYRITKDPLYVGFIGLAEALPYISLALFGGHLADRYPKKRILLLSLTGIIACSLALWWLMGERNTLTSSVFLGTIYALIALIGLFRGFFGPTSSALKADLTPREVYPNAASWSSTFWQVGAITGPVSAGFLYVAIGLQNTLLVVAGLLVVVFVLILGITPRTAFKPVSSENKLGVFQSIREGIHFVFNNKIMLYSISLDLVAVLFGGVIAILPIFAEDILHVGAEGLGILRAAPSVGAVLTILGTAFFSPLKKAWLNMLIAVAGFGLATIVFAYSTNFVLSLVMLFFTGAFDAISVVIRQSILQLVPPDEMRGRVVSVNSVFVATSNEIGAFESGVAAKIFGTQLSVFLGGMVTLGLVVFVGLRSRELLKIKLV